MAINQDYLQFIQDQLSSIDHVETKKMFGGIGFFHEGKMFAMMGGGVFRLKVDASNQADYESKGMKPYQSNPKKKGMPYWEVPTEVLEDRDELKIWAEKSIALAKA